MFPKAVTAASKLSRVFLGLLQLPSLSLRFARRTYKRPSEKDKNEINIVAIIVTSYFSFIIITLFAIVIIVIISVFVRASGCTLSMVRFDLQVNFYAGQRLRFECG